jgi:hypothetical protein
MCATPSPNLSPYRGRGDHRRATEGLAPKLVEQVGQLLDEIARRGVSILLVEQKLTIALRISRRLYVMGHGRIVFEGTPADLAAVLCPERNPVSDGINCRGFRHLQLPLRSASAPAPGCRRRPRRVMVFRTADLQVRS